MATITIFGDGAQVRDYIYVEDIVSAILLCGIRDETTGETVNLGNGEGTSFKTMVETVVDTVGSGRYEHVEWPENYFNIETGDYVADISKARALGYAPRSVVRRRRATHVRVLSRTTGRLLVAGTPFEPRTR